MKRLAFVWLVIGLVPVEVGLASERLAVIVSDLHLDEREDRGPRDGFSRLVAELQERSGDNAELVLNGDAFELAGRDEGDAVVSLDRILAAHPWFGKLLSVFSVRGANRVVFVPGDRDAALLFPAVAARLRERVGAEVATSGIWTSVDGRVVAEHGHQLPDDAYRFEHWPRPFTQNGRLDTSWGERELEPLYELLEQRFPVIRDFATRLSGLKVGLSAANEVPSSELLKLFLTHVSWQQFRRDLELEVRPPEWNLTATRTLGNNFLLHSLPTDDTLYEVWRDAVEQGRLSASDLTDAEVRLVCNYRAAVRRARRRMERGLTQLVRVGPVVAECPRSESSRGPSFSYYWSSRDARYEQHLAIFLAASNELRTSLSTDTRTCPIEGSSRSVTKTTKPLGFL